MKDALEVESSISEQADERGFPLVTASVTGLDCDEPIVESGVDAVVGGPATFRELTLKTERELQKSHDWLFIVRPSTDIAQRKEG